jgi:glycosyltransferase involved in cell wall biosynthesis
LINSEFNVLLISDGSLDATADIGRSLGISVLELPINLGVGGALRTGFKFAVKKHFAAVVQVDADGQHPVREIANLIDEANRSSAHMVIGSRFRSNTTTMKVSGMRRVVMRILSRSASAAANTSITDSTSGFRLIREPLLTQFATQFATNYLGDTYEAVVSAGRSGYKVTEIAAGLHSREFGQSSASTASAIRFTLKGLGIALLRLHNRIEPSN